MGMITRRTSFLTLALLPAALACKTSSQGEKPLTIAVIPKGTTHEFWKAVHAGAAKAAKEAGVTILWKGPLKEDDLKAQIDIVQSMVTQGVSGIVLAPLNAKALVNAVKAAMDADIPVVIFDSDLQSKDYVSFVATDNQGAGKLAADHLAKAMGAKGNVIVLRYQEGSASTQAREQGFLDGMKAYGGISVLSANQYGGATTESAFAASENLLAATKATEGNVQGAFCPNESTTFGMLLALQKASLAGKVQFVGFDASEKLVTALAAGQIQGLVVQSPFDMGETSVRTIVGHLHGQKAPNRINTAVRVVTKDDLNDPAVKQLVMPDFKQGLGE